MRNSFLSGKEVCDELNISWTTLYNWRRKGLPHHFLEGGVLRAVRYDLQEVIKWANKNGAKYHNHKL